jgi:hypothetical protein
MSDIVTRASFFHRRGSLPQLRQDAIRLRSDRIVGVFLIPNRVRRSPCAAGVTATHLLTKLPAAPPCRGLFAL